MTTPNPVIWDYFERIVQGSNPEQAYVEHTHTSDSWTTIATIDMQAATTIRAVCEGRDANTSDVRLVGTIDPEGEIESPITEIAITENLAEDAVASLLHEPSNWTTIYVQTKPNAAGQNGTVRVWTQKQ